MTCQPVVQCLNQLCHHVHIQGKYHIVSMGPKLKARMHKQYLTHYTKNKMHMLNVLNSIFQTPNTQLCSRTVCRLILHKQLGRVQDTVSNSYVTITQTS